MHTTRNRAGMLLMGAIFTAASHPAHAQGTSSTGNVSMALTYAASHSNHIDGTEFWLQGGSLSTNAQFYRGLGIAASATGFHSGGDTVHAPLDLFTIAFGPSYTVEAGRHLSVFGEALLGEAHGFHSVFSTGSGPLPSLVYGTTDSANALALQTGGALDLRLRGHLAIRIVQVSYLRTQLPNGGSNLQQNLGIAAGFVLRLKS